MKKLLLMIALALAACAWLAVDTEPATPLLSSPGSEDVRTAELIARRAEADPGVDLLYGWDELDSALRLIGQVTGQRRLAIRFSPGADGHVTAHASLNAPAGLWINPALTLRKGDTLSDAQVHVGQLPIPRFVSRWVIVQGLSRLGEGANAWPAPEDLISHVDVTPRGLRARLSVPFPALMAMGGQNSTSATAINRFCSQLSARDGKAPLPLPALLRLAFADPAGPRPSDRTEFNQATFNQATFNQERLILLTMLGASAEARRAIPGSRLPQGCPPDGVAVTLHGRADLAQHWLMSAALAARFGSDISSALGFWKELSDSGTRGSGFSYVDLAADCAGMSWGITLASPGTAAPAARKLAAAAEPELMPVDALTLEEGLSEAEFAARHGGMKHAACMRRLVKRSQQARESAQ